jgi:hypothetical protein
MRTETVFLNFDGATNQLAGIDPARLCSLAGRYDNPIPTRFLAPIDCSKIPAQYYIPSPLFFNPYFFYLRSTVTLTSSKILYEKYSINLHSTVNISNA